MLIGSLLSDNRLFILLGTPGPLVFHAPQVFLDCLQQRISSSFKKKRLPNSTVAFSRRDAIPLGLFTKYTWRITDILHVKQIFDTPEVFIISMFHLVKNCSFSW